MITMNCNNTMKKDLAELYKILYNFSQSEASKSFLNKDLLKKLKYDPKDIENLLQDQNTANINKKVETKIRPEILNIKTEEEVYTYLEENIFMVFQNEIDEVEKNNILKKITAEEIKYLYQIVSSIKPPDKIKKLDMLYKLRSFYFNKKRAADLMKNLY